VADGSELILDRVCLSQVFKLFDRKVVEWQQRPVILAQAFGGFVELDRGNIDEGVEYGLGVDFVFG